MIMIFINIFCFCAYFFVVTLIIFLLFYFDKFPCHNSSIRFKNNFIDSYFDSLFMLAYDLKHTPKDAFRESGIVFYEGPQGSGKTISMIHDVMLLQKKYPKVKVIDNLNFKYHDGEMDHPNDIIDFNNGVFGVISAVDECAVWFSNRNYKDFGKESNMLQVIFENRKCRRLLLGTTQKFSLIDKNLRLQTSLVRTCYTWFGIFSFYIEKVPNLDSDGNVQNFRFKKIKWFVHTLDVRSAYDTYHVIKKFKVECDKDRTTSGIVGQASLF